MKPDDTSLAMRQIIDAYLEMALGVMALRIPQIQDFLIANTPRAVISTSYAKDNQNLVINAKGILEGFKAEGLTEIKSLQQSLRQVNRVFILSIWDVLTEHRRYSEIATMAEIQFLRHVRNACGHDGTLNFSEMKHTAAWRDKTITESMRGMAVFPNLLADGDPPLLMLDINNKFFTPIDHY